MAGSIKHLACVAVSAACLATAARAEPRQDPAAIYTFQIENDATSTQSGTSDRYYTSGVRLGWTSSTIGVPEFLTNASRAVWGDGVQRVSIDVAQSLFTPADKQRQPPNPGDRPYAGYLRTSLAVIHDKDNSRSVLGASLGVVGPGALGHITQNAIHSVTGDPQVRGWSYQLQNEPAVELLAERTYRLPVVQFSGVEVDALPALTVGVGTVRDYVQAGASVRFGQGLQSDFGAPRIRPGMSGSDPYTPTRPLAWYVFAGASGQAVARDVFIEGSTFRSRSPGVDLRHFQGEFQAGIAIMAYGLRISYTQTWRTEEFKGQRAGLFNFGSLAVSGRF